MRSTERASFSLLELVGHLLADHSLGAEQVDVRPLVGGQRLADRRGDRVRLDRQRGVARARGPGGRRHRPLGLLARVEHHVVGGPAAGGGEEAVDRRRALVGVVALHHGRLEAVRAGHVGADPDHLGVLGEVGALAAPGARGCPRSRRGARCRRRAAAVRRSAVRRGPRPPRRTASRRRPRAPRRWAGRWSRWPGTGRRPRRRRRPRGRCRPRARCCGWRWRGSRASPPPPRPRPSRRAGAGPTPRPRGCSPLPRARGAAAGGLGDASRRRLAAPGATGARCMYD